MKSGKRETTKGIQLSNQESIKTLGEKEKLLIVWNIGSGHYKRKIKKKKIRKQYIRRTKKLLKTKICIRNLIKRIYVRAVFLIKYS